MGTVRTTDGAQLAYEQGGAGRDLVLVHGITESRHAWDPVVADLESRWRVTAVDVRGHGESERRAPYDAVTLASDLATIVDTLDLERPLMVGHSMGGVIVSAYGGAGHPARGIVNVDQPMALGAFKAALEPLIPMLQGDDASFREAVSTVFAVLDGALPAAERTRLDALARPEQAVVLGVWSQVFELEAEELDALAAELLSGIRESKRKLLLGGIQRGASGVRVTEEGDFQDIGTVYFNESASANILSCASQIDAGADITYEKGRDRFVMIPDQGKNAYYFGRKQVKGSEGRFYICDSRTMIRPTESVLVQTVEDNMRTFTKREVMQAKKARELLVRMGFPSVHSK